MRNVVDLAGQNAGFLDAEYDPLQVVNDPSQPDFRVRELTLPDDVSLARLYDRRDLLQSLNSTNNSDENSLGPYQQRAFDLLRSDRISKAFSIASEPAAVVDRYGRHKLGQSLLSGAPAR